MEKQMFDAGKEFVVKIQHPDFPGGKACTLRYPSDEEWAARTRGEVRIQFDSKDETSNSDTLNGELFDKIRLDSEGPEFDDAEKSAAIGRIENVKFVSIEKEGARYTVTLRAAGREIAHTLNPLTEKQKREFGKAAVHRSRKRNFMETRVRLEPSADLWSKLSPETKGYVEGSRIPIIHKDVAVTEVLRQQHAELEDSGDPEF